MSDSLKTITRFGDTFKVLKFSKPLIYVGRNGGYVRRKKSQETIKQAQNIYRAKNKINEYITICNVLLKNPSFATFTYTKPQHDIQQAISDWRNFTRRMKRSYPDVAFVRVPERHKSGAVHFHAVLFGLPSELPCLMIKNGKYWKHGCPVGKPCERRLRALASVWGLGFVDLNQVRKPEAVGVYIAKYLTKGEPDWTLFGSHVYSPNYKMLETIRRAREMGLYYRITSYHNPYAVETVLDDLKNGYEQVSGRSFETHWLGTAIFEIWKDTSLPS